MAAPAPETKGFRASSMESFLDDYQAVRMGVSLAGLAILLGFLPSAGWNTVLPYILGLGVLGGHAVWCRLLRVRSPRSMLVLDTTVWGGMMVLAGVPVISTAIMIFLFVLVVLFAEGFWRLGLLGVTALWFILAGFTSESTPLTLEHVLGVLLIAGALATLIARIRGWLGRLDAGRSQMLGTVSHELRNNLTGVMGLTEIVGMDDLSLDETRELVALAHQQAVDASEIVEDLLTATRLENSALSVTVASVDVNHEVETTARRFSGAGTALTVEADPAIPPAAADALRVRQVLRNLISNAVRYGGDSIKISTHSDGASIEVTVADDGPGVPKRDEASIFLPYRRSTGAAHAESVGLGLWVSRQLAVAMGGSLQYRRTGGWTEFVFSLPARASRNEQSPVLSDPSPNSPDADFPLTVST
jgi:signal transduction histidine kinase